ncbi:MAG TPA: MFS transporter, partial [Candidatus Dormibacteraeota bacterium]
SAHVRVSRGTPDADPLALWTLVAGNGVRWLGIGFFVPFLPLFIGGRGGGAGLVGMVFAARLAGSALGQYPGGWLSDRWGSRPVVVVSLGLFALGFPMYLLPIPSLALVGIGFAHSLVSGLYEPAARSVLAEQVDPARRGRAYSRLQASTEAGLLLGPAAGGLAANLSLAVVFWAAAGICLAATLPLLRLPGRTRSEPVVPAAGSEGIPAPAPTVLRRMLPLIAFVGPVFWMFAVLNTVSILYVQSRGAGPAQVGVYYAAFSMPVVVLGAVWPGLPDRLGYVRAAALALLSLAVTGILFPLLTSVTLLIGLSFAMGVVTMPILSAGWAEISRRAPPGGQGRAQALGLISITALQAAASLVSGATYQVRPALAFWTITAVSLTGLAAGLALDRWHAPPPS